MHILLNIGSIRKAKMRAKNFIFFRNDDVRDKLDQSLVSITELFIDNRVPISHAVEPANVSDEVIKWLIEMKKKILI